MRGGGKCEENSAKEASVDIHIVCDKDGGLVLTL
jgi:hypothetical protein